MAKRERSLVKGRWRAIALSVLLHGGIVVAAVYGWFTWKHSQPESATMAIEATVVDERALKGIAPPPTPKPPEPEPEPAPEPEPPPPEEQGPPKPDPAEIERKQEEERLAQEKLEQEKLEQQKREQEKLEAEKKEQEKLEAEQQEAEKRAAAKAAAEKAAAEKAAADKKAAEKKKADEAAAAKKAAEEKARLAREAELRRSLEAEERGNALRNSPEASRWVAAISAKIARAWAWPPSARSGVTCRVSVRQVLGAQGGEVTSVQVMSCNVDDVALRESVERAVYNASPLPPPPDPALFQSTLVITFAPE
jgi:colicin import membrane protein